MDTTDIKCVESHNDNDANNLDNYNTDSDDSITADLDDIYTLLITYQQVEKQWKKYNLLLWQKSKIL